MFSPKTILFTVKRGDELCDMTRAFFFFFPRWGRIFPKTKKQLSHALLIVSVFLFFIKSEVQPIKLFRYKLMQKVTIPVSHIHLFQSKNQLLDTKSRQID